MEKKITIHVVKSADDSIEMPFTTKRKAEDAQKVLAHFNVESKVEKVNKTVTI